MSTRKAQIADKGGGLWGGTEAIHRPPASGRLLPQERAIKDHLNRTGARVRPQSMLCQQRVQPSQLQAVAYKAGILVSDR